MSITDELREWVHEAENDGVIFVDPDSPHSDITELLGIADRIDEQYDRTCRALDSAWSATAHEILEQAIDELSDEWVKLPVDADGVPIHIGDRVENNERVVRIVLTDGSWEPSVYVEKLPNILHEHFCHEISHYHAPTVEDVLRRFLGECESASALGYTDIPQDIFNTYAAKLRLAGEAE